MLENYSRIHHAAGLSIALQAEGDFTISACSLKAEGQQLDFEHKLAGLASLEELQKRLPAGLPVSLNLSGKGILIKQVERQDSITEAAFSSMLPNARPDDFYVQHFASGSQSFVALIRKAEADRWVTRINALGFRCLSLSLGAFPVAHILPQLSEYGEEIVFDGHQVQRDQQQWLSYKYQPGARAPFPIKLAGEKLEGQLVLPYAAAFQLILSTKLPLIQAEVPSLNAALTQKLKARQLQKNGMLVLGVFFILLLGNFLLFSYYERDNQRLAEQVSRTARSTTDLAALTQRISSQEALLQTLGWEAGISKSSLVDQAAQCLPPEVSWQQAAVDPARQNPNEKAASFARRVLRISGTSAKIVAVNEWLARLRARPWVRQAQLTEYRYNPELATGQFTLTLNY